MGRYYYAGGERVPIEADGALVAIDQRKASAMGLAQALEPALASEAPRLPGGMLVARRASMDKAVLARFRSAGALQPVYRHEKAMMVALPEIRVELEDPGQRKAVLSLLAKAPHEVEVSEASDERLVLRPKSQSGDDALDVANFLVEQARPAAASVRFVQFVPRPLPKRR